MVEKSKYEVFSGRNVTMLDEAVEICEDQTQSHYQFGPDNLD
jgi:hypothetical protein